MLPNRASATALLIARALVLLAAEPRFARLVSAEARALAVASLAAHGDSSWDGRCRRRWFRNLVWRSERALLPGIVLHYAVRKLQIEAWVRSAVTAGAGQLLVLGAGFDALATRIARRFPNVVCVECDHPRTHELKRSALTGARSRLIAVDLVRDDVARVFASDGVRRGALTVIVAEGLLMYLDRERVRTLLCRCAAAVAPGSHLVLTAMTAPMFAGGGRAIAWWLRRIGEPFLWHLPAERLRSLLTDCGWAPIAQADHRSLQSYLPSPIPLAAGEILIWATRI